MTPQEFLGKWRNVELKERSASQSHFNDLCALLGVLDPIAADPKGEWFAFEKGASKTSGGEGWADVWRRGCFAWEYKGPKKDLNKAYAQLLQYSVALENPPLLIVSDMDRIRIHTNWTNTVQEVHEFTLEDLVDGQVREKLKRAFTDPDDFKPSKTRQALTEETAREFASIAQRLRDRGHEPHRVAHFVNQLVFCMFAEDVGLLPDNLFTKMLDLSRSDPASFAENASTLFGAMAQPNGKVGFTRIDWFNGGLFQDDSALPVTREDVEELYQAALRDWSQIDPSILGTLFERGLDPAKRSQLGAHYTDREKIMMIVKPVIIDPLEAEWAEALARIAEAATHHGIAPGLLDDLYELTAVSALLRSYLGADGQELGRLGSLSLDAARQSFKRVDKDLHKLEATAIVAKRLGDRPPVGVGHGKRSDFTELRLLEHEVGLTRPRTPLRDVVHRAGQALQALQPVWMMSPTSIAQFIRPGSLSFDLLIIDEASQMRPEFSVSCILRADQFVVVGDANQLPPSDHFQVASLDGEGDSDGVGVDEGTESILDLAKQRFRTQPRLKWHYRSQHESLIQFSNREFYERDLVVFPSPQANDDPLMGVKCYYAPAFYSDTAYESSINQREAELVIEQAFGLMQTHPERSIGIVAMNAKQTELLKNEFERLKVEEERVRKYVEAFEGTLDEFFIKNLENVQGDERDIILISTVYGPDKNGVVRQNFGLMNREVGWRRLNVLVTRAKMSCRLITSLRPDDIKVTEKSSKGVIKFKSYLTYAHGGAQYEDGSGGETDSDFEIFVADALRGGGYDVVYQVGVEKFRIDLGVRHASCPVGFIAGIECDGAPYHSGLSVRDRDHIRQTILENLGWNIYRVWSTDWFADPARETAKLLAWLERVRERIVRELGTQAETLQVQKPKSAVIQPPMPQPEPRAEDAAALMPRIDELLPAAEPSEAPREPRGRQLRTIGDFQAFEAVRGNLYEIWKDDTFLGEVEVVRRATSAPRLFGDRALAAQSEYEGRVEASGDCFRSYDLYAAMREVASRASEAL